MSGYYDSEWVNLNCDLGGVLDDKSLEIINKSVCTLIAFYCRAGLFTTHSRSRLSSRVVVNIGGLIIFWLIIPTHQYEGGFWSLLVTIDHHHHHQHPAKWSQRQLLNWDLLNWTRIQWRIWSDINYKESLLTWPAAAAASVYIAFICDGGRVGEPKYDDNIAIKLIRVSVFLATLWSSNYSAWVSSAHNYSQLLLAYWSVWV